MACSPDSMTLAYPCPAGDSILFLNVLTWKENKRPELKLFPMTSTSSHTVLVTSMMYGEIPGKLPKPFLMVCKKHTCVSYLLYSWKFLSDKI